MNVLAQAGRVLLVATLVATAVGVLRGLPPDREEAAFCADPAADSGETVHWVSQEDARALLDRPNVTFVDARPVEEYHAGHVTGSVSVPVAESMAEDISALLRGSETIVTYCDTTDGCNASTHLAGMLAAEGFSDVRILEGGVVDWMENGYPAEAGACHRCP